MNPVSVVQPVPGYLERLAVVVACPAERQANVSVEPRRCREVGAVEPDMIQSDSALWRSSGGGGGNRDAVWISRSPRSEEHTSELQSRLHLVCRLLLGKEDKQ